MAKKKNAHNFKPTMHFSEEADVAKWVVNFDHKSPDDTPHGGYHPKSEYDVDSLDFDRLLNGFFSAFGTSRQLVRQEFRDLAKKTMKNRGKLRKSALRWLLEGRIPGVRQPVQRYRFLKRVHEVLLLADMAETLLFEHQRKIYGREHTKSDQRITNVGSDDLCSGVSVQADHPLDGGVKTVYGEEGQSTPISD